VWVTFVNSTSIFINYFLSVALAVMMAFTFLITSAVLVTQNIHQVDGT
jgi:hypothetical protein